MINDYMNAGLYKQALDGNKLLSAFSNFLQGVENENLVRRSWIMYRT